MKRYRITKSTDGISTMKLCTYAGVILGRSSSCGPVYIGRLDDLGGLDPSAATSSVSTQLRS